MWHKQGREKHRLYVAKPERGTLARCRCKDNIKIALKEMKWKVMEWIDLVQDMGKRQVL